MEFIDNLSEKEYEQFVSNHPTKSHFMQSYYWGEVSKEKGLTPHYVGLKKDNILIATALLLEKQLVGKYNYLYCPRGFVCDFNDLETIKIFTKHLRKYGKKNKSIFIKIDPDVKLQQLDSDGNVINKDNNNYDLVDYLKKLGYKHKGFNKNFENNEPRYTFRLLLKEIKKIHKELHPTIRKIINKGNLYNLDIYKGNENDLKYFYETMLETSKRENLIIYPIEYYKKFYTILNNHNMSDIYVVKIKIDDLKNTYQKIIKALEKELKELDPEKYKKKDKYNNKVKEFNEQIDKNLRELKELDNIEEKEIILSSIITTKYKDKVWTVHGGNHNLLRGLNANYWLYYTIIKDAYEDDYKILDFFGTTGIPDKTNPIYGIHLFKKRFGGEYTEFIGEFDLILNKFIYFTYTKIFSKYRNFMKKIKKKLRK